MIKTSIGTPIRAKKISSKIDWIPYMKIYRNKNIETKAIVVIAKNFSKVKNSFIFFF
jgi:hypothetical protein